MRRPRRMGSASHSLRSAIDPLVNDNAVMQPEHVALLERRVRPHLEIWERYLS